MPVGTVGPEGLELPQQLLEPPPPDPDDPGDHNDDPDGCCDHNGDDDACDHNDDEKGKCGVIHISMMISDHKLSMMWDSVSEEAGFENWQRSGTGLICNL